MNQFGGNMHQELKFTTRTLARSFAQSSMFLLMFAALWGLVHVAQAQITEPVYNNEVNTVTLKVRDDGQIRHALRNGTLQINSKTKFKQKVFVMKPLDARKKIFNKKGAVLVSDDLTVTGNINDVDIADLQSTVNDIQDALITAVGSGLTLSGNTLSLLSTCTSSQLLKFNGTEWACADDNGTAYTAGSGITITSGAIASSLGTTIESSEITDGTIVSGDITDSTVASADIAANTITDSDVDLSGNWTVTGAWTLSGNFVNTASPWADNEVVDALTISGGTIENTPIGASTESTGNFTNITVYDEARLMQARPQIARTATNVTIASSVGATTDPAPAVVSGLNGQPIVAYYDDVATALKVGSCAVGSTFCSSVTTSTVDGASTDVGRDPSVVLGTNGLPIISYYDVDSGNLKIAFCANAACSSATVSNVDTNANDVGWGSSIAISSDGTPIISYIDKTSTTNVKVAKCNDAVDCDSPTLTDITTAPSSTTATSLITGIAISPQDGFPLIVYIDNNDDLAIIDCSNAACSSSDTPVVVHVTITVDDFAFTIDHSGLPLIAYVYATSTVAVAQCDNNDCATPVKTDVITSAAATYIALTIGVDGFPLVGFEGAGASSLPQLARCSSINCSSGNEINTSLNSSDKTDNLSVAVNSNGLPLYAFYNSVDTTIKLYQAPNNYLTPGLTLR